MRAARIKNGGESSHLPALRGNLTAVAQVTESGEKAVMPIVVIGGGKAVTPMVSRQVSRS